MIGLKLYRKSAGITLAALAEEFGVSVKTVWSWEAGKQSPSLDMAKKLASRFDCSIEDLIAEKPSNPPHPQTRKQRGAGGVVAAAAV